MYNTKNKSILQLSIIKQLLAWGGGGLYHIIVATGADTKLGFQSLAESTTAKNKCYVSGPQQLTFLANDS